MNDLPANIVETLSTALTEAQAIFHYLQGRGSGDLVERDWERVAEALETMPTDTLSLPVDFKSLRGGWAGGAAKVMSELIKRYSSLSKKDPLLEKYALRHQTDKPPPNAVVDFEDAQFEFRENARRPSVATRPCWLRWGPTGSRWR